MTSTPTPAPGPHSCPIFSHGINIEVSLPPSLSLPAGKAAGNAVKRASDNLVKAAQKAAFDKSEDDSVVVKTKFVGGIAQVTSLFSK